MKTSNLKSLREKSLIDQGIMKLAKVTELRHIVATTDKGDLCLCLRKGETHRDYQFVLDAVPYSKDDNKDLIKMFDGILYTL